MNIKVKDIMVSSVITSHGHKSVGHIRDIMDRNSVHSIPIVNAENEVEGIITLNDLHGSISDDTLAYQIMTKKVLSIPKYSGVHIAARVMRNHHIHHLVVTHENKIVGVLSSFDLVALVENHRYISKNPPTPSKKNFSNRN